MSERNQEYDDWVFQAFGLRMDGADGAEGTAPASFEQDIAALEPKVMAAMQADPESRTALSASWSSLQELREAKQFDRAAKVLAALTPRVEAALQAGDGKSRAETLGIEPGLVAQRRAALEAKLKGEVQEAKSVAGAEVSAFAPELDELMANPQTMLAAIQGVVGDLFAQVETELTTAIQQDDATAVRKSIDALRSGVERDKRLAAIGKLAAAFELDDPRETFAGMFEGALSTVDAMAS